MATSSTTSSTTSIGDKFLNKVVVITGGAMGIGRAIAEYFYNQGASVAIFDREITIAQQWIQEVYPNSSRIIAIDCDVSKEESVQSAVQQVTQQYTTIHTLVNNAATFVYGTIDQVTNEQWDRTLNVNIKGYAFTMKYIIPIMKLNSNNNKEQSNGSIVNISSISAFCGQEEFVPYSVTKAAVLQMTRNVAMDVGKFNIRVNCVSPGPILTEATSRHAKGIGKTLDEVIHDLTSHLILKRMGKPDEVAKAVGWLASDESSFTTGSNIMVDGGYLLV